MTLQSLQNRINVGFNTPRVQKLTEEQIQEIKKAKMLQDDYNKKDNMKMKS